MYSLALLRAARKLEFGFGLKRQWSVKCGRSSNRTLLSPAPAKPHTHTHHTTEEMTFPDRRWSSRDAPHRHSRSRSRSRSPTRRDARRSSSRDRFDDRRPSNNGHFRRSPSRSPFPPSNYYYKSRYEEDERVDRRSRSPPMRPPRHRRDDSRDNGTRRESPPPRPAVAAAPVPVPVGIYKQAFGDYVHPDRMKDFERRALRRQEREQNKDSTSTSPASERTTTTSQPNNNNNNRMLQQRVTGSNMEPIAARRTFPQRNNGNGTDEAARATSRARSPSVEILSGPRPPSQRVASPPAFRLRNSVMPVVNLQTNYNNPAPPLPSSSSPLPPSPTSSTSPTPRNQKVPIATYVESSYGALIEQQSEQDKAWKYWSGQGKPSSPTHAWRDPIRERNSWGSWNGRPLGGGVGEGREISGRGRSRSRSR